MAQDDAISRLARKIDATQRAERLLVDAGEVAALRRRGASELHRICAGFVASVNERLTETPLELVPPDFTTEMYRETGVNLLQISSRGRAMQIVFEAPANLVSTDKFAISYVLEGEIRTYNQKMLEHSEIRSLSIFYCVENQSAVWRFFDWRTRSTGPVSGELLIGLIEPLF